MTEDQLSNYRPLLAGLLDGELSTEEATELNDALTRSARLREEYEALIEADQKLSSMRMLEPSDIVAQQLWKSPYHRIARYWGFALFFGGFAYMSLYSTLLFFTSSTPLLLRIAGAAILLGSLLLLATSVRERLKHHKQDPYKEIER